MDFKTLKLSMERTFEGIVNASREGDLPQEKEVAQFVRQCRQLHMQAEEDWAGEAEDFAHLATQLHQAVKNQDAEEVVILVQSLNDAQSYCHRMFKA